jgi:inosine/xanthosine triphosphate pyrophosphatase family protein
VFLIPRFNKTFGELSPEIKATLSHRFRALKQLKAVLKKYLEDLPKEDP